MLVKWTKPGKYSWAPQPERRLSLKMNCAASSKGVKNHWNSQQLKFLSLSQWNSKLSGIRKSLKVCQPYLSTQAYCSRGEDSRHSLNTWNSWWLPKGLRTYKIPLQLYTPGRNWKSKFAKHNLRKSVFPD